MMVLAETDLSKEVETAKSKIQNNENLEDKEKNFYKDEEKKL